jgi:hypothetical protein
MPFKSTAQRAYLAIHNPKVAHEFGQATPKGAKLPYKVGRDGKGPLSKLYAKSKGQ